MLSGKRFIPAAEVRPSSCSSVGPPGATGVAIAAETSLMARNRDPRPSTCQARSSLPAWIGPGGLSSGGSALASPYEAGQALAAPVPVRNPS